MLKHLRSDRARKVGADGFTLIELLVVIVILGILAAVVVIGVGAIQNRGEVEACKTELRSVRAASAAYFADTGDAAATTAVLSGADYIDAAPEYTYSITQSGTAEGAVTITGTFPSGCNT